ncbi:hypothetical protein FQZ97_1051080 [compost metagenome]
MRILVDLDGALPPLAFLSGHWGACTTWIKDIDYHLEPEPVLIQKLSEFGFKFNLALEFRIVLEAVQRSYLFCQLRFKAFEFR